jgi:hypothetical protein
VDPDTESGEDDANRAVAQQLSKLHGDKTQNGHLVQQKLGRTWQTVDGQAHTARFQSNVLEGPAYPDLIGAQASTSVIAQ